MYQYSENCSCGRVTIEITLPKSIDCYRSRKCDCDYCAQHNIEYLSDPKGTNTISSALPLLEQKQGSEQATFLVCCKCSSVVGVCYKAGDINLGSVNIRLFEQYKNLQGSTPISPKLLNQSEKILRWCVLWSAMNVVTGP
jgi:hypothetical protein